ncbi:thioredoxin-like protein [Terfezia claveryi]|nr:thioredoxin-like protein [Terfezia claveryi]
MRHRSQSESPWEKAQDKQFSQLKLNHIAPNFHALSSHGPIELYEYLSTPPEPYNPDETTKATVNTTDRATKEGSWVVFFSYPMDSSLACMTEVASMAELQGEFAKRGAKLLGLTIGTVEQHRDWMREIRKIIEAGWTDRGRRGEKSLLNFPIIADEDGYVSQLYGMLEDPGEATEVGPTEHLRTVRSMFIIDPNRHIRLITAYPNTTGGKTAEILRALDELQRSDQAGVLTPEGWT